MKCWFYHRRWLAKEVYVVLFHLTQESRRGVLRRLLQQDLDGEHRPAPYHTQSGGARLGPKLLCRRMKLRRNLFWVCAGQATKDSAQVPIEKEQLLIIVFGKWSDQFHGVHRIAERLLNVGLDQA